jgi:hypothetical protein
MNSMGISKASNSEENKIVGGKEDWRGNQKIL